MSRKPGIVLVAATAAALSAMFAFAGEEPTEAKPSASSKATAPQTRPAEDAKAKRRDVVRLMEVTGTKAQMETLFDQMIAMYKRQIPDAPDGFWEAFREEVDASELIERCIPAYEKHLSHEDIKGLVEFYESPLGRRLVKAQPLIIRDTMRVGEQWGRELGRKVQQRLEEDRKNRAR